MSDTALDKIINVGTAAARAAFTPSPGTSRQLFIWVDNDSFPSSDPATWVWDSGSSAWIQINTGGGGGGVTTGVTLTNNQLVVGAGASAIKVSDLTGDVTTSGAVATTIANSAVTLAKIANAAANSKWLGSGAAGSGAAYTENSFGGGLSVASTTLSVALQLDYAEVTSNTSITATSEATANTIVTGSSVAYDGATAVIIEFFSANTRPDNTVATRNLTVCLYEDGSSIGQIGTMTTPAGSSDNKPIHLFRRMTPSNASHTYSIRAFVSAGTGVVAAGAGGTGALMPAFIRITRAA